MRACAGHDRFDTDGLTVVHVDCDHVFSAAQKADTKRCVRCSHLQKSFRGRCRRACLAGPRSCEGHDVLAAGEVVRLGCENVIGGSAHGAVKRCGSCEYWQKRFWSTQAKARARQKIREEMRDGC